VLYYIQNQNTLRAVYPNQTTKWTSQLPNTDVFGSNPSVDESLEIVYVYESTQVGVSMGAFDTGGGAFLWSYPPRPLTTSSPVGSPVIHPNGYVLISAFSLTGGASTVIAVLGQHKVAPFPYPDYTKWVYQRPGGSMLPSVPVVGSNGNVSKSCFARSLL
jgi:hypothetical protein